MNETDLVGALARSEKLVKWGTFLLGVMLVILLVDLQLKRSIGRQAILASEQFAKITSFHEHIRDDLLGGGLSGRQDDGSSGDAGNTRGSGVGGDAPLAEGTSDQGGTPKGVARPAPRSTGKRAPGNGRRTGRAAGGS